MRESARGVFGWIIIGAIVLVLSVFGFGALNFFVTSEPAVATVGDTEIKQSQLLSQMDRERRRLLASMGPDADASLIDEDALAERVLGRLIERQLLLEGAENAGLGAPAEALDEVIVQTPEFQVDGSFDADRYRVVLAQVGMSPLMYREALGDDLMLSQLSSGIGDSAFVTARDLEQMAALSRQERDVAWLTFAPSEFEDAVEIDDAAVADHYEANRDDYRAPERVAVRYVVLDRADLAADIEVTEEALRTAYASEVEAFEGQERRRASHILLTVDEDRSEAEAVEALDAAAERIRGGEDFAAVADEISEDVGSAAQGGDLGFLVRGSFEPAFERALFGLEGEGALSEPVVTSAGVHLIRLEEVARTDPPTFERLRGRLAERIRERRAQERFDEARAELETIAYEAPDLTEPAEVLGLEIRETPPFTRTGGDGPFADQAVIDSAFSADVLDAGYNSPVLSPREGLALVLRVAEHQPERQLDLEEVEDRVRADLIEERAAALAEAAAEDALERLRDGTAVSAVAAETMRDWTRREGLTRDVRDVPAPVVEAAFTAPRPGADERSQTVTSLAGDARALVVVTAVRPGDLAALTEAERGQLERLLRSRTGGMEFEAYRAALQRDLGVSRRAAGELPQGPAGP
jgi:peptidyl-prolyl cis-trans isomerase D